VVIHRNTALLKPTLSPLMIKSWLEWTTVTCCAFSSAFSLMDSGRRMMSVRKLLDSNQTSADTAILLQPGMTEYLNVLLNFSPDAFSLSRCFSFFIMLLSLSYSVYGCFVSLSLSLCHFLSLSPFILKLLYCTSSSWGHTISSLCSSRGNTFFIRSAVEVSPNLLWSLSSSFLLYTAPCREIFSCFSSLFLLSLSLSLSMWPCPGWTRVGGPSLRSLALSCQCVFAVMMRGTVAVLHLQAF